MRRLLGVLILVLVPLLGGCAMPPLRLEPAESLSDGREAIGARENLAAFLTNRAIREHYEGRRDDARRSADFALEWAYVREADELRKNLGSEGYRPQLVRYTAEPGMPMRRERPGTLARALLYPVIGLPLDLVELPFKAVLAVPVLGDAFVITTVGVPIVVAIIGVAACDTGAGLVLFGLGAGALVAESATFLAVNGIGQLAYWGSWRERMEGWRAAPAPPHCLEVCQYDWHAHGSSAPRFFVNARRIREADDRIPPVRGELSRARKRSLDWRNREVDEWNEAIRAGANPFIPVAPVSR